MILLFTILLFDMPFLNRIYEPYYFNINASIVSSIIMYFLVKLISVSTLHVYVREMQNHGRSQRSKQKKGSSWGF